MNHYKNIFYSFRPQQWVKNLFIFLPLIFGKKLFLYPINIKVLTAFILFSMSASVVYLINDILDFNEDKNHPIKKLRPIASGKVSIKQAQVIVLILMIFSIVFSYIIDPTFSLVVLIYILFNIAYSKYLKAIVIIDVFSMGVFYLLRIIAGSVLADVEISKWIIFMTVFLALFLGFNKRRQEIKVLKRGASRHRKVLVEYNPYYIDQMIAVITSSIVVTYMLYTVDSRTIREFGTNHLIYTIPFVYYGIFRYLYLIHKNFEYGDPTRVLLNDISMQINMIMWILACIFVIYFGG